MDGGHMPALNTPAFIQKAKQRRQSIGRAAGVRNNLMRADLGLIRAQHDGYIRSLRGP